MIKTSYPAPEQRTALLVPDLRDRNGHVLPARPATLHHYHRTEEIHGTFPGSAAANGGPGSLEDVSYRHIFVCSVTGATRQYGVEGPNSPGVAAESEEV